MKDSSLRLLTVIVSFFIYPACEESTLQVAPCPFQTIQFMQENSRNQASLELSNALTMALQLPVKMPIQVEDVKRVVSSVKFAADKFVSTPIDSYLAGTLNAYLQGTICNTFIMAQLAHQPDQQMYYDSLLRVQFATLTGFMAIYSQGKVPPPLPGGPPSPEPDAGDATAIYNFFQERLASAKTEAERQEWREERAATEVYLISCRKEDRPADCIQDLLRVLRQAHTVQ